MQQFKITPSTVSGIISVPPSKSHTLRAILFASMSKGMSTIRGPLLSADAVKMMHACRLLGATISEHDSHITVRGIDGRIDYVEDVIDAGNSGIVLRFVSALLSLSPHYSVITGDRSIRHQRGMKPLLGALQQLGAVAISTKDDGFAPIIIRGPLKAGTATLLGTDSQHVSALLIAASFVEGTTDIYVIDPGEKPWIMLTLFWLDMMGIRYENHAYVHFRVFGKSSIVGFEYTVPGDISSAAFPLAAAIITNAPLTLRNIDMGDPQGDKQLIYTLQQMGANIYIEKESKTVHVASGSNMQGMDIDINTFIDALPILAVIACFCKGSTRITNAAIARGKESDRLHAITTELRKMDAVIEELPDGLIISPSKLKGADMHSHHDHRIAMALMCAALGAKGISHIDHAECVAKTYPDVAKAFQSLGGNLEVLE
jgi:3-phosphoshikimate 1-carboxyvinyltransferase